ncbi:uncharacterized protein LOC119684912 [Teleopsis dalmanni]|uniref:uncharacterized protein LOC119684912 n=1 Tax=Teleopsis dalmanni TaxID=139649 RepID=UPI0018CF3E1B|nr:uncharacterized protein LOC119684912 [Teleopsis dalmanni]
MANKGVNVGFAKCFIIFMAVVILVEGLAYIALAIEGMLFYGCNDQTHDIASEPFKFVTQLLYFINQDCGNPSISINGEVSIDIGIDWAKSEEITNRTNIFAITYSAVSLAWVITSLVVLFTICCRTTKILTVFVFWPWFLVIIAGSILDAVATGYHIVDIVHTTSADETFDYIGISAPEIVMNQLRAYDVYFITPAIVMTCISSRVVIIWFLNIFGACFCLSLSRVLAQDNAAQRRKHVASAPTTATAGNEPPRAEITITEQVIVPHSQMQHQPQIQTQPQIQSQPQIQPQPQIQLTAQQMQQPQQFQQTQYPQNLRLNVQERTPEYKIAPIAVYPPSAPSPDMRQAEPQANIVNNNTTYRQTTSHPDVLDYPPQPLADHRASPVELSPTSPLNDRYSQPPSFSNKSQPQRVSAELRSQLPWSYTNMAAKPQPPRKPPTIPEPDYILEESGNINQQTPQQLYPKL